MLIASDMLFCRRGAEAYLTPHAARIGVFFDGVAFKLISDYYLSESAWQRRLAFQGIDALAESHVGQWLRMTARVVERHGAPYWAIHRGDLQAALLEAVTAHPDIELKLGTRVEDFVVHGHGVTVAGRRGARPVSAMRAACHAARSSTLSAPTQSLMRLSAGLGAILLMMALYPEGSSALAPR